MSSWYSSFGNTIYSAYSYATGEPVEKDEDEQEAGEREPFVPATGKPFCLPATNVHHSRHRSPLEMDAVDATVYQPRLPAPLPTMPPTVYHANNSNHHHNHIYQDDPMYKVYTPAPLISASPSLEPDAPFDDPTTHLQVFALGFARKPEPTPVVKRAKKAKCKSLPSIYLWDEMVDTAGGLFETVEEARFGPPVERRRTDSCADIIQPHRRAAQRTPTPPPAVPLPRKKEAHLPESLAFLSEDEDEYSYYDDDEEPLEDGEDSPRHTSSDELVTSDDAGGGHRLPIDANIIDYRDPNYVPEKIGRIEMRSVFKPRRKASEKKSSVRVSVEMRWSKIQDQRR